MLVDALRAHSTALVVIVVLFLVRGFGDERLPAGATFGRGYVPVAGTTFTEVDEQARATLSIAFEAVLFEEQSAFQHVMVLQSTFFGNILVIDGALQMTERDEAHYHEMLAHVPMAYRAASGSRDDDVLIIGGGDGGVLRQVLRHDSVRRVQLVDIDETVVRAARQHLRGMADAFDNERAQVTIGSGMDYVSDASDRFDVVVVDSTDFANASELFTHDFFTAAKDRMYPDGGSLLAVNVDSPSWGLDTVEAAVNQLEQVFAHVRLFQAFTPTYASGHYSFAIASDDIDALAAVDDAVAAARAFPFLARLHYYTPEMHRGAFALPAYLRRVLAK